MAPAEEFWPILRKPAKHFFHVSKHAISQQSVTICASLASLYFYSSWRENFRAFRARKEDPSPSLCHATLRSRRERVQGQLSAHAPAKPIRADQSAGC